MRTPLESRVSSRAVRLLDRMGKESFYPFSPGGKIEFGPPADKALVADAYRAWLILVQEYSSCRIRRDSEVLIAFSGLGQKFQDFLGDRYVGGHLNDLHRNLLWCTTDPAAVRLGAWHNRASWRAPTWSWASVKGSVKWDDDLAPKFLVRGETMEGTILEYVEHHVAGHGSDTTGALSAAWLKVKADLFLLSGDLSWTPDASFARSWGNRARVMWLKIKEKSYRATAQFDEEDIVKMLLEQGGNCIISMPVHSTFRRWHSDDGKFNRRLQIQGLLLHFFCDNPEHETGLSRIGRFTIMANDEAGEEVIQYFLDLYNSGNRKEYILL